MRVFSSRADLRRGVVGLALLLIAFVAAYLGARQYAPFIFDVQALREWISQFGVFAPLVFVFIQALQVVVAPVPGQIVALVAGYLFGPVAGTVYSLTGVLLGSAVAFSLAKRFGRPMVERLLHEDVMTRFDGFVDRVGIPGLLAFVLIPGLPDDAICFLSGLTTWRLRTFLAVIIVGRLPAYVITVYAGGELANGQVISAVALIGAVVLFSVIGYQKQDAIRELIQQVGS
ncbi:TVP38/TMEM64 family protein [Haloarcula nitratireducens]|uniref:TVP38/TMEM64 family protein n=1 Tax=Haloarcula nitratireducens TaxID=2487749 RepID=A0AAW4PHF7_9EURY|nr:TVP38/TMEM64 family protein [Halomicroarcula nitratireducens]MBX0297465.1 TVP38/TMEM64 family protein [Halomicroarcula nitratireducens]